MTDKGLKPLAKLTGLTSLNLLNTGVTEAGIGELVGLTNLTSLRLPATAITDQSLKVMCESNLLPALENARAFAGRPRKLDEVETLDLSRTRVSDDGLRDVARLKNLTSLDLMGCSG